MATINPLAHTIIALLQEATLLVYFAGFIGYGWYARGRAR